MKGIATNIGFAIVIALVATATAAPWIAPYDPSLSHPDMALHGPSATHLLGVDADGRDVLSLIIYGARASLGISIVVVSISLIVGVAIGLISAWWGGTLDRIFGFIVDVFLAFPGFLLAVAIAAFLPPSIINVVFILSMKGWVTYARLVRGRALVLKEREFVLAARAIGAHNCRIMFFHLFPNVLGPLIVNASFGLAGVIIIESALSFLGLGIPIDVPSWGAIIEQGTRYLLVAPHLSIFPGIVIMLVVLGFNLLGEGVRSKLAIRSK